MTARLQVLQMKSVCDSRDALVGADQAESVDSLELTEQHMGPLVGELHGGKYPLCLDGRRDCL